jgi:integrative and conjugative element protein (TIGR02256 family)
MKFLLPNKHPVSFTEDVLGHFDFHRQIGRDRPEAGGQLFADIQVITTIKKATGPRKWDRRGRLFYFPNKILEAAEIRTMYKQHLHFVGDWHTHPEEIPKPSSTDIQNIRRCFKESTHQLLGFVMVIVGTAPFPQGLSVTFHSQDDWHVLERAGS